VPLGFDRAGNLVTEDRARPSPVLRRITRAGIRIPYAPGRAELELAEPLPANNSSVVVGMDAADNVYAAYSRPRPNTPPQEVEVYRVDPSGGAQRILFARPGEANFMAPDAIAFGPGGEIYFTDGARRRIVRMSESGTVSEVTPEASVFAQYQYYAPGTLSVSPAGRIHFMSAFDDFRLFFVNGSRQLEFLAGQGGHPPTIQDGAGGAARFATNGQPVYDPDGTMYLMDGSTLRKVTPAGVVSTLVGRPETTTIQVGPLTGTLEYSLGLARDADGVFYFRSGGALLRVRLR